MTIKSLKYILLVCFSFSSILLANDNLSHFKKLKINLVSYRNGVGLDKDQDILTAELTKLGHDIECFDYHNKTPIRKSDINIFIEVVDEYFFQFANKNYLMPNPEWYQASRDLIPRFDLILCKTRDTLRIFKPLNPNSVYTGFTSFDKYDESIAKEFKTPIHLVGASIQKSTDKVMETWVRNPDFSPLYVIRHKGSSNVPATSNIKLMQKFLTEAELTELQNRCGMHICPSEMEGFGHAISEALSIGAVVITTDAPPMNEFVKDPRCLVKAIRSTPHHLGTKYFIDDNLLEMAVNDVLAMSQEELQEIGRINRQKYLENDQFFKKKLSEIFKSNIHENLGI